MNVPWKCDKRGFVFCKCRVSIRTDEFAHVTLASFARKRDALGFQSVPGCQHQTKENKKLPFRTSTRETKYIMVDFKTHIQLYLSSPKNKSVLSGCTRCSLPISLRFAQEWQVRSASAAGGLCKSARGRGIF